MIKDQLARFAGDGQRPSEEALNETRAAASVEHTLPFGITYYGPWKAFGDGMGKHARAQVKSLAMSGLPIRLQAIGQSKILNDELEEEVLQVEYLSRISFSKNVLAVKQFVFHSLSFLQEQICPSGLRNHLDSREVAKNTVIYTSWECDRVYPQIIAELQNVAQLWVPCRANKEAFVRSGLPEDKVRVIPYPYDPDQCQVAAPRGREEVPSGKRFYHIGKWEPRKNQHQMLGAFLMAFKPTGGASLLIKTSHFRGEWSGYPSPFESVEHWLASPQVQKNGWTKENLTKRVMLILDKIPAEDIRRIHKTNNIYISSALGEAWDIPAFDAKLAGNRLVYVGFGGPEDYAEAADLQIPHGMQPVDSQYDWDPSANWAQVHTPDFVATLLKATAPSRRVTPASYFAQYGQQAVGELMAKELLALVDEPTRDALRRVGGFG